MAVVLGGLLTVVLLGLLGVLFRRELREWYLLSRFERLPLNAQGYREYREPVSGIVLVLVPGGTFLMGSPEDDPDAMPDDQPQHSVTLSPFLIARCEVSQEDWQRVMRYNPSAREAPSAPVERVSWDDCQKFCEKTGLSLPTEAQWEYACRAGSTTRFFFGRNTEIDTHQANFNGSDYGGLHRGGTVAVDSFESNGFGLYNVHGNVAEWCEDVYHLLFYVEADATATDPVCTHGVGSVRRVIRGGHYNAAYFRCSSSIRESARPDRRDGTIGLRPVFNLR